MKFDRGNQRVLPRAQAWNSAFTLTEVLVSVVLLGMLATSLYACFAWSFAAIELTRQDLRATQVAVQRLEETRLCRWSEITNCQISFRDYYDPSGLSNQTM